MGYNLHTTTCFEYILMSRLLVFSFVSKQAKSSDHSRAFPSFFFSFFYYLLPYLAPPCGPFLPSYVPQSSSRSPLQLQPHHYCHHHHRHHLPQAVVRTFPFGGHPRRFQTDRGWQGLVPVLAWEVPNKKLQIEERKAGRGEEGGGFAIVFSEGLFARLNTISVPKMWYEKHMLLPALGVINYYSAYLYIL